MDNPILIPLTASQDQNVLPPLMQMHRHPCFLPKANQSSRRSIDTIAIESVYIHAISKVSPGDIVLLLQDIEDVFQLKVGETKAGRGSKFVWSHNKVAS